MTVCMWQDLKIGNTYVINAKIFDHLAEDIDYHIILIDIKPLPDFADYYNWTAKQYIFLTEKGYETLIFFPNDDVWFEELQI